MACSNVTGVTQSPATDQVIELGQSLTVTGSFQTDGSGTDCTQTLNWVSQKTGALPSSYDTNVSASSATDYDKTFTPTSAGEYTLYVQCVWFENDPPQQGPNIDNSDSITVQVTGGLTREAGLADTGRTAGAPARDVEGSVEGTSKTGGVEARSVEASLEGRDVGAGEQS